MVEVDEDDPLFQNPTKPIGPFYTDEEAAQKPYPMVTTDKGMRRVIASPMPIGIVAYRRDQAARRHGLDRDLLRRRRHSRSSRTARAATAASTP